MLRFFINFCTARMVGSCIDLCMTGILSNEGCERTKYMEIMREMYESEQMLGVIRSHHLVSLFGHLVKLPEHDCESVGLLVDSMGKVGELARRNAEHLLQYFHHAYLRELHALRIATAKSSQLMLKILQGLTAITNIDD